MDGQRPISKRKTVQLLVILTILAWATQTLFHQWGYGQEVRPFIVTPDAGTMDQKFVEGDAPAGPNGTLELRGEGTTDGPDVKLKQVCRWSNGDAATFAPIAELTVARMSDKTPFKAISIDDIRQTLHDAGVNVALINFAGASACTVSRTDIQTDERAALENWIGMHQPGTDGKTAPVETPTAPRETPAQGDAVPANDTSPVALMKPVTVQGLTAPLPTTEPSAPAEQPHTLGQLLTTDVCQRLNVSPDMLQLQFSPEDQKVLALSEPYFKFSLDPSRMRNLGAVSWDVTIVSDSGATKKVSISARARAWQNEVILARPVAFKQVFTDDDFTDRRIIVDSLPEETLLHRDQCVGQMASRDLKPGTIMTARMVDPIPLVKAGQLVTITLTSGSVQIKEVGRALEPGGLGQSVKVRNETTRDIFDVTMTGPQEGRLGAPSSGVASVGN